ncbi:MAG: hypothetical protein ACLFSQ_06675 [Candidatus Zixiibacteriota bacterium]
MTTGLFDKINAIHKEKEKIQDNPYHKFGFEKNPFPTKTMGMWDRFFNQDVIRKVFEDKLLSFIRDNFQNSPTFLLEGGNRTGKTHFLKHHKLELTKYQRENHRFDVGILYISASSADFNLNYSDMLDQLFEQYENVQGESLLLNLIDNFQKFDEKITFEDDIVRALHRLASLSKITDPTKKEENFELNLEVFKAWIFGSSTDIKFRRNLHLYSVPRYPHQKVQLFYRLFRLLQEVGLIGGIILFVDEFEQLWLKDKKKRLNYFTILRSLLDEFSEGGLFSTFALSSAEDKKKDFQREYMPLYRRIYLDSESNNVLKQITSFSEAWDYIEHYLNSARDEFTKNHGDFSGHQLIKKEDTKDLLANKGILFKDPLPQGYLFEILHDEFERIVKSSF